ncbi:rhodanese-like domain-containing protein [Planomonospora venezuelensis]|uniref:Rhodanese-related sulfurtransferase n=1 Tax=Planomonospora venezuelensis TaxID=1999 RepID=A0A841CZ26_PLAVE|nr:rhodanese-like domain-containing protein [Planomonospora venezuelensis]MBB5963632.1 rhodanese-related sulfurtransferase [Planomonospora venezuelensis]GIN01420.1 hypothetical protein Pve01_30780 [Planomonospora venezuelensis]
MVQRIDRDTVRDLLETRDAQLVEVLPGEEYGWAHLPGARNLPLKELGARTAAELDRSRPVVVYCHDWICDMSPRAAPRLERLGFGEVYDYTAGKMDWLSADLPYEGEAILVAGVMRRDPVIAFPDDRVAELEPRIFADPAGAAVVVLREGKIVQGVVGPRELKGAAPDATAEEIMSFGVTTVRPSEELTGLLERMDRAKTHTMVVTRTDGTLAGLLATDVVRAPETGPDL